MVRPAEVGGACARSGTAELLGYPVATGSQSEVLEMLWQRLLSRRPTHVVTLNPEMIVHARRNRSASKALHRADVFIADGVGLTWAAAMLNQPGVKRYPGIDLADALLSRLAGMQGRVYLLGGQPGVAESAAERLVQQKPGLGIAGTRHGYFDADEEEDIVLNIAASSPDMLLAGLGSPKQEEFITQHKEELNVPLMIGVGGALDVFAGLKRRAPRWVQRAGMEWAYRSLADVSRYKRLGVLPVFIGMALREALGGKQ
jgi:N-acetylglucosaminyldiphosphoundecaprenol N-acetyl-beta-D-mannosaminyltransferase